MFAGASQGRRSTHGINDLALKVESMHASFIRSTDRESERRAGVFFSVAGLVAWLSAMLLAIAGPLLGLRVPPLLIVAIVVFAGAFSLVSLPKLANDNSREPPPNFPI